MLKNRKKQSGFTLIELLLSVIVGTALLIGFSAILQELAEDELSITVADYMKQIGAAVEDAMQNPAAFDELHDRAVSASFTAAGIYEITVADIRDGNAALNIEASSILGQNFSDSSPLKTDISIFLVQADTSAAARALDVVIITDEPSDIDKISKAARQIGAQGGYYFDNPIIGANDPIQGAYGIWNIPFANLSGTTWHTNASTLGASSADGYLAYYSYANEEDILGDYLYRTAQFERPELHQMNMDLDLVNNNLVGADNVFLSGDLNVAQDLVVQGSAFIAGQTNMNGNLSAAGRVRAQNITIGNDSLDSTTRATYNVERSELVAQQIDVGDSLEAGTLEAVDLTVDDFNAESLVARTMTVSGGRLDVNSTAGMAIENIVNTGTEIDLNLQNQLNTNTVYIEANNAADTALDHTGAALGAIGAENAGNVNITGDLISPRIINRGQSDFLNFGSCNSGCFETF